MPYQWRFRNTLGLALRICLFGCLNQWVPDQSCIGTRMAFQWCKTSIGTGTWSVIPSCGILTPKRCKTSIGTGTWIGFSIEPIMPSFCLIGHMLPMVCETVTRKQEMAFDLMFAMINGHIFNWMSWSLQWAQTESYCCILSLTMRISCQSPRLS